MRDLERPDAVLKSTSTEPVRCARHEVDQTLGCDLNCGGYCPWPPRVSQVNNQASVDVHSRCLCLPKAGGLASDSLLRKVNSGVSDHQNESCRPLSAKVGTTYRLRPLWRAQKRAGVPIRDERNNNFDAVHSRIKCLRTTPCTRLVCPWLQLWKLRHLLSSRSLLPFYCWLENTEHRHSF